MARGTRRRARVDRRGGLALVAAIVGVLVLGPNKNPAPEHLSAAPAQQPEQLVEAPLAEDARRVAVRFIQTAVARKNLDEAWTLVGPNLRGGLSKKRWTTGENPVVPYPIDKLDVAPYKVDASYTRSALLEVALLPRKGSGVRAQVFFLELQASWAPGLRPGGSSTTGCPGHRRWCRGEQPRRQRRGRGQRAGGDPPRQSRTAAGGRRRRRRPRRRGGRGARLLGGRLAAPQARQARARGRGVHRPPLPHRVRRRAARLAAAWATGRTSRSSSPAASTPTSCRPGRGRTSAS